MTLEFHKAFSWSFHFWIVWSEQRRKNWAVQMNAGSDNDWTVPLSSRSLCLSVSHRHTYFCSHTPVPLSFWVLFFLLLSACMCECFPVVSVLWEFSLKSIKSTHTHTQSQLFVESSVNSVPRGDDVLVKIISAQTRSSVPVTGVLSLVWPVPHSGAGLISPTVFSTTAPYRQTWLQN